MSKYIAIKINGKTTVHASGDSGGGYDTLCGIDGDDPTLGHYYVPLTAKAKIDCRICEFQFTQWKKFKKSDFSI